MLNKSSQLLLFLWNVLSEMKTQKPPQGFRYASYEVTIPRKVMPRYGKETPEVAYHLQIEGKGYMVHLNQKKGFVPKNLPVLTYSKLGELQVDYPFIRSDCFYQGYIKGKSSSLVTLSSCLGGLRGLFQLENNTYEIEPVPASSTFQHVVYRLEEKEGDVKMKCGLTEEEQKRQETIMMQNPENVVTKSNARGDWWPHTRYVKVAIVIEHERYVKFDKNETLIAIQVLDIVHIANSFYEPLSVRLFVTGLEIWSKGNLIHITDSIMDTFNSFTIWRIFSLSKQLESDAAHLFVYKYFGSTLGLAAVGAICNKEGASAVDSYLDDSLLYFSNTFAHELGHNLGMLHDDIFCSCNQHSCIMAEFHSNSDKFSNCSYYDYFKLRNSDCLLIPPDPDKIYKVKYCGNKIVERGEQCDCGSKDECETHQCCQSNCKLRFGATCAFGQCCANCQYVLAQSICRENTSICDLPEYCNGTSEWCPKDVYIQDGAPCSESAYCYNGNCTTHVKQCKMIFGKKAKAASESCFRDLNNEGDRFGNCGLKHGRYKKCNTENILCGRIQCENIDHLPSLEEHRTIIQTVIGNKECWSIEYHSGMNITDIGAVRDGTSCGTDMMCIDGQCLSVSLLEYDCNVSKCHNRGICNTHKNCHCDYGWAPPDCLNEGYGGSMDSGPPPPQKRVMNDSRGYNLLIILFFFSTLAIAVGLGLFFRKKLIHHCTRLREWAHPAVRTT